MVVKMIKWRPWPPAMPRKKFEAKMTIHKLKGLTHVADPSRISAEINWRKSKSPALTSIKRSSTRKNSTKEQPLIDGFVQWDEEFHFVCALSFSSMEDGAAAAAFHPWEVSFNVFNVLKNKSSSLLATLRLNIADYASSSSQPAEIELPMSVPNGSVNFGVTLNLSITLREIKNSEQPLERLPRPTILSFPRSPCYGEMFSSKKEANSALSTKNRKPVNLLKGLSLMRRGKTTAGSADESSSSNSDSRSDKIDDSSSFGGSHEEDSEEEFAEAEEEEEEDSKVCCKSFGYGTLAHANHSRDLIHTSASNIEDDEDWVYYAHRRSVVDAINSERRNDSATDEGNAKRTLIPWRKRRLSLRLSPKEKGEPLLKKCYGEEGGDDIDFDRRQLSSSDESNLFAKAKCSEEAPRSLPSPFGDDDGGDFSVGAWEHKEIASRDGRMKLNTNVFFASIDQRSERADGESACATLAAAVAQWFGSNRGLMPVRSQLDGLIRDGSLQWRSLCEDKAYSERFPDKHFDLETVIDAKAGAVHNLSLVPEKSFVGFFRPDEAGFEFLKEAMSFDDVWAEVGRVGSARNEDYPLVYIVGWNDHFFVLVVERRAYYVVDTLGERLYEGCDRAFILKFDEESVIERVINEEEEEAIVCEGKECCKEYVKGFLAAIPTRELGDEVKKGLVDESRRHLLHQRLQIEFHYTSTIM